jgi:hypothetical protein
MIRRFNPADIKRRSSVTGRFAWIARHQCFLSLALVGAVVSVALAASGPALGAVEPLVVHYEQASGDPTPRVALRDPSGALSDQGDDLTRDVESHEQDDSDELARVMNGCFKGAIWDIPFDAFWDWTHGQSFDLASELGLTNTRLAKCLQHHAGFTGATATSVSEFLTDRFEAHAIDFLSTDPVKSSLLEWMVNTSWYGFPR